MIKTTFVSDCFANNIDEIKIAALYFEKIEIENNRLYHVTPEKNTGPMKKGDIGTITGITEFITEEFIDNISILIREGIVEIVDAPENKKDKLWEKITSIADKILSENIGLLVEEKDIEYDKNGKKISSKIKLSGECLETHKALVGPIGLNAKVDLGFIFKYYSSQLSKLLMNVSSSRPCLTSSHVLNDFLKHSYESEQLKELQKEAIGFNFVCPNLAFEAVKMAVPNISSFPFEEVLEAREKSKDELMRFRDELEIVQFDILSHLGEKSLDIHAKELVKYKIKPTLDDLSKKMKYLDLKLPKKALDELKNPASYTPLLGTFLGGIPAHIATLLSLGVISLTVAYDYIMSRKEIKDSGFYYLINLRNKF